MSRLETRLRKLETRKGSRVSPYEGMTDEELEARLVWFLDEGGAKPEEFAPSLFDYSRGPLAEWRPANA